MAGQTFTQKIKVHLDGANKAASDSKKVSNGMKGLAKSAIAAGAAYFGARGIINGIEKSLSLFKEQELAQIKLNSALGKSSSSLKIYASSLQKATTFGDELILQGMAQLAFFIKDEKQLKIATKATLDLAAAKGMDLVQAADLVAKSVGSSTNALSRYGIAAEGAVGSNERLFSITNEIEKLFGGQATAVIESYSGKMEQLDNRMGDISEVIGEVFAPAALGLKEAWVNLAESVSDFLGLTPDLEDAQREATAGLVLERTQLNRNIASLKSDIGTKEDQEKIIIQLNEKYGTRIGLLLDEESSLEEIAKFQKESNDMLQANIDLINTQAAAQFYANDIVKATAKVVKNRVDSEEKWANRFTKVHGKTDATVRNLKLGLEQSAEGIELLHKSVDDMTDNELADHFDAIHKEMMKYRVAWDHADGVHGVARSYRDAAAEIRAANEDLDKIEEKQGKVVDAMTEKQKEFNDAYVDTNDLIAENQEFRFDWTADAVEGIDLIADSSDNMKFRLQQAFNDIIVYSQKSSAEITKAGLAIGLSAESTSDAVTKASTAFITAQIQQAISIMIKKAFGEVGFFGGLAVAAGSAGVGRTIAKGIQSITAAEGFDGIVDEPTLILAGEAGPEYVDIEPTVNEGEGRGGGTIIFQGNVMSDSFIEEEAIPKIKEALRRGESLGIS